MRHRLVLLPVLVATLVGAPPALAWTWPTDGPVLQPFVLGDDPYAAGQHRGIDVAGIAGAPVRAPAGGSVSFAGTVPGGGRTVTIQTGDGYAVTLLHLGTLSVSRGVVIDEGAAVGTLGMSGDAEHAVPSVHFGVRVASDPQGYRDPLLFLPARGPASSGEVVAPGPEVEPAPAPAPSESVETGGLVVDTGSEPGGLEGSAPVAPASPAGVELPVAPAAPVELPAPAVPSPVSNAPAGATAPATVGERAGAPRFRAAPETSEPGEPPAVTRAQPEGAGSADAPLRNARPEPSVASISSAGPGEAPAAPVPVASIGLAATAALALLAAGLLGLRLRRRVPAVPAQAPGGLVAARAAEDTPLELETVEPRVPAGARRRSRPPGGPGRRLERLGPHGTDPLPAGRRRARTEPVDVW